jgi:hypothetical protein
MLIIILIGCYYLITVLIFTVIHNKKTSNIASKQNNTSIHNILNNTINEPLLSPINEPQYDIGYQLN